MGDKGTRYSPPFAADLSRLKILRGVLASARFSPEGILETIGVKDAISIRESDVLLLMHRTAGGTPLHTLIRLFLIEVPVPAASLAEAIVPMTLDEWEDMGLIRKEGDTAYARVKIFPYLDMVIAYDPPRRLLTPDGPDYVMGVGGSSLTLANLTIRNHVATALDLGTGCGFQAFMAAKHCDHVIAVDRNPRAVAFASFNAKLNGLTGVECREGDFFEPVEGMKFDLIVSNPPFVISPESRYIYRDGGMAGDEVSRKICREAPRFMTDGGFCQLICNWAEYKDQDWREHLRAWFEGSGCDVWVIRNQSRDVAVYAANWLRHTERLEVDDLDERFADWLAYYRTQGIDTIGAGVITMRRTGGVSNWFRADDGVEKVYGPGGEYITGVFEARDFLERSGGDGELSTMSFVVSPDLRITQEKGPSAEGWAMESLEVYLARGLFQKGKIDPYVERLLMQCDGTRPLGDLTRDMASQLGVEAAEIEPAVSALVRDFVGRRFLLPVGGSKG